MDVKYMENAYQLSNAPKNQKKLLPNGWNITDVMLKLLCAMAAKTQLNFPLATPISLSFLGLVGFFCFFY
jgi:hypothetical protein